MDSILHILHPGHSQHSGAQSYIQRRQNTHSGGKGGEIYINEGNDKLMH